MSRVRVGIVSWNTAGLLDRCLAALPAALSDLDAEVVVVDNASADESAAVAERHRGTRLVRNRENRGYARAMNQALAGTDAQVLIALNPDTEPPPGSLAALVERLLAQPDVGLVAPRLTNPDGTLQHSAYRFPSLALAAVVCFAPPPLLRRGLGSRWWLEGYAPHDRPCDVDWAIGAVHVIRAAAVDRDRPYPEDWFMYVEDLDLCWQLARRGWRRRLEATVAIPHVGNASGRVAWGTGRTERWLAASLDWYARTYGPIRQRAWALVNAWGLAVRLVGFSVRRALARPGSGGVDPEASSLVPSFRLQLRAALTGAPAPDNSGPAISAIPEEDWNRQHVIALDHRPSADNRPRYGYGRPPHSRLAELLAQHRERYRAELTEMMDYASDLERIPARPSMPGEPCWLNRWLLGLDTASLYGYLRRRAPARYIEVGSGQSTLVAGRARRDGNLSTSITSIDPQPRADVDALCDRVVRQPLELANIGLFESLEAGDMVFLDASHRVFMNSDMVAFYLDVLPELPSGVLVGIHDVLWPDDYPPEWAEYWFSEQYLLAAYLLAGASWMKPLLACNYASQDEELRAVMEPLWDRLALAELDPGGFCFWFAIER